MKKHLMALLFFIFALVLVACGTKDTSGTGDGNTNGDGNYDLGGIEFVIRANIADRLDPRNEQYERMYRNEKVQNIKKVEEKYNVKVVYKNYPAVASWGTARDNWIIQQAQMGLTDSHVFEVSSNSVATLAVNDAILPLDDLIEKHGQEGFWTQKREMGTVLGKSYAYDDTFPYGQEGIFYNSDLLSDILGDDRRIEPTKLWLEGKWTWEAYEELVFELYEKIGTDMPLEEQTYVMGGRAYDWLYPMVGSNGGVLVDSNFQAYANDEATIEALEFLSLFNTTSRLWIDNAREENTIQPEFRAGKVLFHHGQNWYLTIDSRWENLPFSVDFVPMPMGPRVQDEPEKYALNKVFSDPAFVISSAFSKDRIPEGYEDQFIHDELIFQIWNEIIYFPEIDETTGEGSIDDLKENYYANSLYGYLASEESREAHLDVYDDVVIDFLYSVMDSQTTFKFEFEKAIKTGDIRGSMESLQKLLQDSLNRNIIDKAKTS